jgi:hypothetical protein
MESSATRPSLYQKTLIVSLSTAPKDFICHFNIHALWPPGRKVSYYIVQAPHYLFKLGALRPPRLLFGTSTISETPHNNLAHVDDTRSYHTVGVIVSQSRGPLPLDNGTAG